MATDPSSSAPGHVTPAAVPAGVDDPAIRTFGLLLEAHARLTRVLDQRLREDTGTNLQTLEVLLRVGRAPDGWVPVSRLAETVALTSGGISRLVDRLEAEGLLCRQRCASDGRVVELRLTGEGVERLDTALVAHRRHLAEEVSALIDPADIPALERSLDRLRGGGPDAPC